ncbi:unnamed protein product [Brassica oleracea]
MARVDCSNLDRSSSPSFPYYGDWNFGVDSNLKPKVISLSHQRDGCIYHLIISYLVAAKTNMEVLLDVVEEEAKLVVAKPQRQ